MSRLVVVSAVGCLLVIACNASSGALLLGSPTLGEPKTEITTLPLPTVLPVPPSIPRMSPSADLALPSRTALTALERSDLFWKPLAFGGDAPQWPTLRDVVEASDLVVRGRVTDVRLGRKTGGSGPLQFVLTTIELAEVLKGIPETRLEGTIDVEWVLADGTGIDELRAGIPDHETTFFLYNQGLIAERAMHPEDVDRYRYQYTVVSADQGALRDIAGMVRALRPPEDPSWFPGPFEGAPYEQLLVRTRTVAADPDRPPSP